MPNDNILEEIKEVNETPETIAFANELNEIMNSAWMEVQAQLKGLGVTVTAISYQLPQEALNAVLHKYLDFDDEEDGGLDIIATVSSEKYDENGNRVFTSSDEQLNASVTFFYRAEALAPQVVGADYRSKDDEEGVIVNCFPNLPNILQILQIVVGAHTNAPLLYIDESVGTEPKEEVPES